MVAVAAEVQDQLSGPRRRDEVFDGIPKVQLVVSVVVVVVAAAAAGADHCLWGGAAIANAPGSVA